MDSKRLHALEIVKKLRESGFEALWAGGCVRDQVMGHSPHDYDIATSARPEDVMRLFPKTIPVGVQFGVILVMMETEQFEVATFRSESGYLDGRRPTSVQFTTSREDVLRRDFTVNGLLYDPIADKVIDYVDGVRDIHRKVIRTIGDASVRFEEDKLRLLRALRFSVNLGFELDQNTFDTIVSKASSIHVVSAERIRDELVKIFTGPRPGHGLHLLSETRLLKEILPEIEAMKGVAQPVEFHPEGDVYVHTKMLLDQLSQPDLVLVFGSLLHDVGKPPTQTFQDRIRFNNHQNVGAKMAESILKRLRFSNHEVEDIVACVANHMKFKDVKLMREAKLRRFIATPTFSTELEMHRIDCLASHGMLDNHQFLKEKFLEYQKEKPRPEPLMTGQDLIHMGFKPGPLFKQILTAVEDAALEKTLTNREDAIQWVRDRFQIDT